jgi:hypothetical protein
VFDDGTIIQGDEVGGLGFFVYNPETVQFEVLWQTDEDDRGPFGVKAQVLIDNVTDDQAEGKERTLHDDVVNPIPLAMAGPDGELTDFNDPSWPDDDVLVTIKVTLQSLLERAIQLLEENNSPSAKEAIRNLNAAIREFARDNDIKGLNKVGNGIQNVKDGGDLGEIPSELETEVQELLVEFVRNLAVDAIDLAEATEGADSTLIAEAQEFLAKGDEKRAMEDYESAHTFYKSAFVSATEALP